MLGILFHAGFSISLISMQKSMSIRERQRTARRESILEAARQILMEAGFEAMTMDAVAEQAMVTKPTLYAYFPNKLELAVTSYSEMIRRTHELRLREEANLETMDRIQLRVRRGIETKILSDRLVYAFPGEPIRSHPEFLKAIDMTTDYLAELFERASAEGKIDQSIHPKLIAQSFVALLGNPTFERLIESDQTTAEATVDTLTRLFLGMLESDAQ
jgi:AcrR family transcriptional regulator